MSQKASEKEIKQASERSSEGVQKQARNHVNEYWKEEG